LGKSLGRKKEEKAFWVKWGEGEDDFGSPLPPKV
jgi:hypothetical protein